MVVEAELAGLQQHTGYRLDQSGDADRIRLQRLDLGELGGEIRVLAAERFDVDDVQPLLLGRCLHHVEAGFRERIVIGKTAARSS